MAHGFQLVSLASVSCRWVMVVIKMTESNCLITVRLPRSWSCPAKMHLKRWHWGEQDGGGVGGCGVHLSSWIHQEHTFRHRSACRTPAESKQEYLPSGKNTQNHAKLGRMKELGRKAGVLVGLDLPLVGGGNVAGVRSPLPGNCLS